MSRADAAVCRMDGYRRGTCRRDGAAVARRRGAIGALVAAAVPWLVAPVVVPADTVAPTLPATVERLDAERGQLRREAREADERRAAVRRDVSDLERRRQEVLRQFEAEAAALAARQAAVGDEAARARAALADRDAEIEHLLRAGGRWVSFTDQIAPILRARCVACHTPREPGGGHVLTHYAALLADGPAGPAVVPGDPDSPLCAVVADGSMPKDGAALSAAEVELIRRWVALGARLDAGADPEAALVRVMPRVRQPDPPAVYPAAMAVSAVAFHPDGTRLASAGYHEVLLWSLPEGRLLRRITNVAERVHGLAFHPDGRRLAVAAGTPGVLGEVKLFDATDGALLADLGVADDALLAVAFAADGGRLVACGTDHTVRLFETDSRRPLDERSDHADWVRAVAFAPDGRRLVTASRDATAKVVDLGAGRLTVTFAGHAAPVTTACWLPDNALVATGGEDGAVRLWNPDTGKEARRIGGFTGGVDVLCVVGTDRVAAADRSGTVRLHRVADGKQVASFEAGPAPPTGLAASPDGRQLAIGSLDGGITLITVEGVAAPVRWRAAPTEERPRAGRWSAGEGPRSREPGP